MLKLSVIGLGKLGSCTAACFAAKGFEVLGLDVNKDFVDAVNSGRAPVIEPRLQEFIEFSKGRLRATQDYLKAIRDTDITFLIVPTPSKEDGNFSSRFVRDALTHLAAALRKSSKQYHLFVVTSTVSPGTTDEILIPLIEKESGKKLHKDFGVCYSPEFIALGTVITDFLNPDLLLIGESSQHAGDLLKGVYEKTVENKPHVARMSIVSAEITKISLNAYVTMKISFANTLSNICEGISSANIDHITKALGSDKRISPYYLKGGLSFGGPCFPRDNRAFAAFAAKYNVDARLARVTDEVNHIQTQHLANKVISHLNASDNKAVSILGLAYKPKTPIIEESAVIKLIEVLLKKDVQIIVYDPLAQSNARAYFGDNILYAESVRDCIGYAQVCVIATHEEEFRQIDQSYIVKTPTTIIDCWRLLDPSKLGKKVKYVALGKA